MTAKKVQKTAGPKNETAEQKGLSPEEIVDARTQDGSDDGRFRKVFVVLGRDWDDDEDSPQQQANKVAVLQEALLLGLHPRGDVSYEGSEEKPDGKSLALAYSVEVIPASIDDTPGDAVTPSKKLDELGGSTQSDK